MRASSSIGVRDEVPDPYYGGERGFSEVLDLIEVASEALLKVLREERMPGAAIPS